MSWRSLADYRLALVKEGELDARGRRHDAWTPAEQADAARDAMARLEERRAARLAEPRSMLSCVDCQQVPPWPYRGGEVLRWEPEVVYQCAACRAASPRPVVQRAPWDRR